MDAATLLASLAPLTHADRCLRLIALGRQAAAGDDEAAACLGALRESERTYERLLFMMSIFGSRDAGAAIAMLDDPSRSVRRRAVRLVSLLCNDQQASLALAGIEDRRLLLGLVRALRTRGRVGAIDAYIARTLAAGDHPADIDLFGYASAALVQAHWPAILASASPVSWKRLARHHAALTAAALLRDITVDQRPPSGAPGLDPRQRWRIQPLLRSLAEHAPDGTLALVHALFQQSEAPSSMGATLQILVRHRPCQTFDLLRSLHESARPAPPPGAFGGVRFDNTAHHLGVERLTYLIRHAWHTLSDGAAGREWLLRLQPAARQAVLRVWLDEGRGTWGAFLLRHVDASGPDAATRERAFARWSLAARDRDGVIALYLLDALPRELRQSEARRHLSELPVLTSRPQQRLAYARLLPFAEARAALHAWIGHPDGEERARALGILISCVAHHPPNDVAETDPLTDALAVVRARRFEQDPVRLAMLTALAALPLGRFLPVHLPLVAAVFQDALDAADLSPATAAQVERLVTRLFHLDGAWGATWMTRLLEARGHLSLSGLGLGLTALQTRALAPALAELASLWSTRERVGAIITLAAGLGVRLPEVPALLDALVRLARELPFASVAAAALDLLRRRARPRFTALVPELLAADRSFSLLPSVAHHVSVRRQDLLDPLLAERPMTGRFASGRTHWVIDFGGGTLRWTPAQQQTYGDRLVALLREDKRDTPTLRFALTALSRLAFADPSALLAFAADPRPPVREIAVRSLPWLDAGQGVPLLIQCLGDDRARYAIYALRKTFSEMTRERVLQELRAVPLSKVTVAKEVVRLLGEMGGADAYGELVQLDRPGLHRDVRIALLRALWSHLERPQSWPVFERAVADSDWLLASKAATVPLVRLSPATEERVVELLARVLGRPESEARLDLLHAAAGAPLRDERRSLQRSLLAHLDGARHPDEAAATLAALLQRMWTGEADEIIACLRQLLPSRRLLLVLLPVLSGRVTPYTAPHELRVVQGVVAALGEDHLAVPYYLGLGGRIWDWRQLAEALVRLAGQDLLHADAMQAALVVVRSCLHPELLEQRLRDQKDARLRRLALCALEQAAAPQEGWTRDRLARLQEYRGDPSPLVAGAASFVLPPE